jgi:hypothetical protein
MGIRSLRLICAFDMSHLGMYPATCKPTQINKTALVEYHQRCKGKEAHPAVRLRLDGRLVLPNASPHQLPVPEQALRTFEAESGAAP